MELTKDFVNTCRSVSLLRDFLCQAIDRVDSCEQRIKELEVINKDLIKDRNKTYNIYESRIKELEKEVDAVKMKSGYVTYMESQIRIDELEARIKELEAENNRLRYERLIKSSILYRNHANEYNWEQLLLHNKIKNMSIGEFIIRMVAIADAYEARANEILERK